MNLEDFDIELRWTLIEPELHRFQSYLIPEARRLRLERDTDVLDGKVQKGVYLLFDDREQLIYIGFSLDGFGNRFARHRLRFEWKWADFIVFPNELEFFAPALEAFLVNHFRPPLNASGNYI
jgi:hypothetical protein